MVISGCTSSATTETGSSVRDLSAVSTKDDKIAPLHHDFGFVLPNSQLKHEFVLTNGHSHELRISDVKSSCVCTAGTPSRDVVPPGESVVIPVTVKSGVKLGVHSQRLLIITEDKADNLVLSVTWNVKGEMTLIPESLRLTAQPGQNPVAELLIENFSSKKWSQIEFLAANPEKARIQYAVASLKELPVQQKGNLIPLQRWNATLNFKMGESSAGECVDSLRVVAKEDSREFVRLVEVAVTIAAPVRAIPDSLLVVDAVAGSAVSKTIIFRYPDDKSAPTPDRIVIRHDLPLEMKLNCESASGRSTNAVLDITPPSSFSGSVRGSVDVEFGEPVNKTVEIPIVVVGKVNPSAGNGEPQK